LDVAAIFQYYLANDADPEIQRISGAVVMLEMISFGLKMMDPSS
jgi:hypothetical protein